VIDQIIKTLKTQTLKIGGKYRRTETKTMIWCWKYTANTREGIGIGNEFLRIASQVVLKRRKTQKKRKRILFSNAI